MGDASRPLSDAGRKRQASVFISGLAGRRPAVPVDVSALESAAGRRMSAEAFAYVAGAAGTESTMRANRAAFEARRIVPRVLRDVSSRDISVELFGTRLPSPFLLAPIGVLDVAHQQADLAVARAAVAEGTPMIFSSQASRPMEECAGVMGDGVRWFQLYWSRSSDLVRSFVKRAENCGCTAIVLTLDTTMLGWRSQDLDLAYLPFLRGRGIAQYTSDPVFRESLDALTDGASSETRQPINMSTLKAFREMNRLYPGRLMEKLRSGEPRKAVQQFIATYSRPSLTWDDLGFLRDLTRLPILLKGILHPNDAVEAVERGMDGIIVSNHGGRQIDGAIAALDALPAVMEAVKGRMPVLMDSGIRTGSDAFKALALGATAVCIGRPYVYGLALAGETGVREVMQNLIADFDLTMGLAGCRSVAEIGPQCLRSV